MLSACGLVYGLLCARLKGKGARPVWLCLCFRERGGNPPPPPPQLHPSVTNDWLAAVSQYLRAAVYAAAAGPKPGAVPPDCVTLVILLQQVCRVMRLPERILHSHVPAYLLDTLQAS